MQSNQIGKHYQRCLKSLSELLRLAKLGDAGCLCVKRFSLVSLVVIGFLLYHYSCLVFCVIQTYSECETFFYCHSERSEESLWPEGYLMAR